MISDSYKEQLQNFHKSKKTFLNSNSKYIDIKKFVEQYDPKSIIDFGCAQGKLIEELKKDFPLITTIDGYDPGVEEFQELKELTYECLISNDVIEHIEPEYLENTLRLIDNLFYRSAWLIIACYPAKKKLPDGRNAHLIIEPPSFWEEAISKTMVKSKIVQKERIELHEGKPELRLILEK